VKLGFLAGLIVGWPKILLFSFDIFDWLRVSLTLIALKKKRGKARFLSGLSWCGNPIVLFFSDQIQFWANRYLDIGFNNFELKFKHYNLIQIQIQNSKFRQGFTLIELLVVIAIIGILARRRL